MDRQTENRKVGKAMFVKHCVSTRKKRSEEPWTRVFENFYDCSSIETTLPTGEDRHLIMKIDGGLESGGQEFCFDTKPEGDIEQSVDVFITNNEGKTIDRFIY